MFPDWPETEYGATAYNTWSQSPYFAQSQTVANNFGINPAVMAATFGAESGFNPSAVNPTSGATGIGQLMPSTAVAMDVDPTNPVSNMEGSAAYFAQMLQSCNGDNVCASIKYGTLPPALNNLNPSQQLLLQADQNANGPQCSNIGGTTVCAPTAAGLQGFSQETGSPIKTKPYADANGGCQPLDIVCQIKGKGSDLLTIIGGLIIVTIGLVMLRDNANVPEPIRQLATATHTVFTSAKKAITKPVEVMALAS